MTGPDPIKHTRPFGTFALPYRPNGDGRARTGMFAAPAERFDDLSAANVVDGTLVQAHLLCTNRPSKVVGGSRLAHGRLNIAFVANSQTAMRKSSPPMRGTVEDFGTRGEAR